jgi:aspartate/methionine/tyrosine aminotransferase
MSSRLAEEANRRLHGSIVEKLLSHTGRRFYAPVGLSAQIGEARQHAHRFNASIGMAAREGQPLFLPTLRNYVPELTPEEIFAYAPPAGVEELRDLWQEMMLMKNPDLVAGSISRPIVVPGLTSGITTIADLFVDDGDSVALPALHWGNYRLIFEARRAARLVTYPLFDRGDRFDLTGFERALKASVRGDKIVLILNFPHNPTGYCPTADEASSLVAVLNRLAGDGVRILVITDDAYFGLFYEEECYRQSLFAPLSQLHENILAFKVGGPTKEDLVWGFRIGFITFASKGLEDDHRQSLEGKLIGAVRSSVSNSNRLAQSLLIRAMKDGNYSREKSAAFSVLRQRYRAVKAILSGSERPSSLTCYPFNSGYFMAFRLNNAEAFRKHLLLERGVGTVSLNDETLRIAYCNVDDKDLDPFYAEIFRAVGSRKRAGV